MTSIPSLIASFARSHAAEQLDFLVGLCNQNSFTHNKPGTDRVAAMVLERLDGVLPEHETIAQAEVGDHHILRSGGEGAALTLVGHLDTVFPADHPFQTCSRSGDVLTGPGALDMKGGVVVMVYALRALAAVDLLGRAPLALILNGDEEIGSRTSREIFERHRPLARACLVAECAGLDSEVVLSRNGKLAARLDCFGTARHVGMGPAEKSSAILELARKVVDLESLNGAVAGVNLNVGRCEGGLGAATIAHHASALLDVRWVKDAQRHAIWPRIQEITATVAQPGCRSEIEILNERPAMPASPASEKLFAALQATARALGQELLQEHRRGTSDANFFGSAGVPTLDGLGPVGFDDHTADEWIRISSLEERTTLLATFLAHLMRGEDGAPPEPSRRQRGLTPRNNVLSASNLSRARK